MSVSYRLVNRRAVIHNLTSIRKSIPSSVKIMAVVKNNAYGHGAVETAREAEKCGFSCLGTARVDEAIDLRQAGISLPVFILGDAGREDWERAISFDFILPLDLDVPIEQIHQWAFEQGKIISVMIPVDTGLHRIGILPEKVMPFFEKVKTYSNIRIKGFFTQLADPESKEKEISYKQLERWNCVKQAVEDACPDEKYLFSAADSGAVEDIKESWGNMVRVGSLVYGIQPSKDIKNPISVISAMEIHSRVTHTLKLAKGETVGYGGTWTAEKDTWLAVIPIGYGDGYRRSLSGKASVLIGGKRRKILGLICMDQMMVEGDSSIRCGDEVVLVGRQKDEEIRAEELADLAEANTHEWLGGFRRLPLIWK